MPLALELDHLVIAARTLEEGAVWSESSLGVAPLVGGRHAFMGTHNRVFSIASAGFGRAYLEIIAIDPDAPAPLRRRWFDLDDVAMQRALAQGPRLVHWAARCDDLVATRDRMRAAGVDAGEIEAVERATPRGVLRWQIGVRDDGGRPLSGAAPALIAWGERHPTDSMSGSGAELESMSVSGWPQALRAMLPPAIRHDDAATAPPIVVRLSTPRGPVTLQSIH